MRVSNVLTLAFAGIAACERLWVYPLDTKTNLTVANLNVVSNGKEAYLGDYTKLSNAEFAPVTYTLANTYPAKLVLNPDSVSDAAPTWSNRILGVPKSGNSIVLLDPSTDTSDYITDFWPYGTNIFPWNGNTFVSWEYAVPTDKDGLYTLEYWTSGKPEGAGAARITFRSQKL